jgi:quercetin dioxygenase-like cupin family protein
MVKAVSIEKALSGLTMLDGRTAATSEVEAEAAFATLASFGTGGVFAGSFAGESPWERHGTGDELVHVLKGATRLTIVATDGTEHVLDMQAGMLTVVPRGCWHRFEAPHGVTVLTATPLPTDHATTDPREDR